MTNYLDSFPLATVLVFIVGVTAMILYYKVEPFTRKTQSFYWHNVFPLTFHTVMLTFAMYILVLPPWSSNLLYDIFLIRVNGEMSAHVWSYLTLPTFYVVSYYYWRDAWRSFLGCGLMAYIHEAIWFIYYYFSIAYTQIRISDVNFILLITPILLIYMNKYRFNLSLLKFVVMPQFLFDAIWYSQGFHITVTNYPSLQLTQYAADLYTNGIEISSWLLLLTTMLMWLTLNRRKEKD
jgi:hypothetical protein